MSDRIVHSERDAKPVRQPFAGLQAAPPRRRPALHPSRPAPPRPTSRFEILLPPLQLTPHDRFTIPHHPDEVPTVPPQALVALEQEITEGTARVEKAEENKPAAQHDLNKYYHYLVDLVEDIEHARATLFVYAALTHTQTISLLRQFVEAQEKIDKQFEQEQEDLFDGELSYACTRPIRAAVKYRHELLYDFLGQVARRGHKKYVLDARDCEVIAQMWGMPSPPVVAPGYWPSSSRGLKP